MAFRARRGTMLRVLVAPPGEGAQAVELAELPLDYFTLNGGVVMVTGPDKPLAGPVRLGLRITAPKVPE